MKFLINSLLNHLGYEQFGVLVGYLRASGWVKSFLSGRPVDARGAALPWYNYPAIHFLAERLAGTAEWLRVFEFGSGNSTLWWGRHAGQVVAVEDSREWYEIVVRDCPPNITYLFASNEADYLDAMLSSQGTYDVVVVDGSYRNRCMMECVAKLNDRGVLVVDNSDWPALTPGLDFLAGLGFRRLEFYGFGPVNGHPWGTSFLYRADNLLGL